MINGSRRALFAALAAAISIAACSEPASKPKPAPEVAVPKLGVVGHVAEVKDRGMTRDNWTGVVTSLFSNETDANVSAIRYEVTVLYDDSTTGVIPQEQKPDLRPGQRVRVTGNKIEPIKR
jgi:hypothetical protein